MENSQKILFFDGVCNLCNGFVDFLMGKNAEISFTSLQGETAQKILPQDLRGSLSTVIYFREGEFLTEGRAVAEVLKDVGGLCKWLGFLLAIFPQGGVNAIYKMVAEKRYSLFGRRDTCRLPSETEKKYFLP